MVKEGDNQPSYLTIDLIYMDFVEGDVYFVPW